MKNILKVFGVLVGSLIIAIGINIFVELGVVFVFSLIPAVLSNMFSCASAPAVDFSVIDDIVAYAHCEGSIRIIFTAYLLGIVLSAVISTFLLFGECRLTKGSKVLSVLMTPILSIYFLKCCTDIFGGTNVYIAKLLSDGGVWANLVSIGAVMLALLLSIGVIAASWNKWGID